MGRFRLTKIIPFIQALATWGQHPVFSHTELPFLRVQLQGVAEV